jgi:predicted O-methyltransferase YrrM
MRKKLLDQMREFYARQSELMVLDCIGEGLWPVDFELGRAMYDLILKSECRFGVEVGAGVGYSTVWIGLAMKETGGLLVSFEYFPPKVELLEEHVSQFGLSETVEVVESDLLKGVDGVSDGADFVFLDARKCDYLKHLQLLLPKLKKGAVVCADNVMSHAAQLAEYLDFVRHSGYFKSGLVDIGSGMEVSELK